MPMTVERALLWTASSRRVSRWRAADSDGVGWSNCVAYDVTTKLFAAPAGGSSSSSAHPANNDGPRISPDYSTSSAAPRASPRSPGRAPGEADADRTFDEQFVRQLLASAGKDADAKQQPQNATPPAQLRKVATFRVRRRYRQAAFVQNQLARAHPGVVIPPLPPASIGPTPEVRARAAGELEKWVNEVCSHRILRQSALVRDFLFLSERAMDLVIVTDGEVLGGDGGMATAADAAEQSGETSGKHTPRRAAQRDMSTGANGGEAALLWRDTPYGRVYLTPARSLGARVADGLRRLTSFVASSTMRGRGQRAPLWDAWTARAQSLGTQVQHLEISLAALVRAGEDWNAAVHQLASLDLGEVLEGRVQERMEDALEGGAAVEAVHGAEQTAAPPPPASPPPASPPPGGLGPSATAPPPRRPRGSHGAVEELAVVSQRAGVEVRRARRNHSAFHRTMTAPAGALACVRRLGAIIIEGTNALERRQRWAEAADESPPHCPSCKQRQENEYSDGEAPSDNASAARAADVADGEGGPCCVRRVLDWVEEVLAEEMERVDHIVTTELLALRLVAWTMAVPSIGA